ncbi:MAG: hypothetical protein R3C26_06810 [Calditrichia bacterium]
MEAVDGIEWIRLPHSIPQPVRDELIDWMANSRKIVPYLDMPYGTLQTTCESDETRREIVSDPANFEQAAKFRRFRCEPHLL